MPEWLQLRLKKMRSDLGFVVDLFGEAQVWRNKIVQSAYTASIISVWILTSWLAFSTPAQASAPLIYSRVAVI